MRFLAIFTALLFSFPMFSQEVSNASRYEFLNVTTSTPLSVTDPLFAEENAATSFYKQDRKYRLELVYNRNNHTDKLSGTYWKMDVVFVCTQTNQTETLQLEFSDDTGIYSSWADFMCLSTTPTAPTMNWTIQSIAMQKKVSGIWTITTNTSDLPMQDIHIECIALNDRMTLIDLANCSPKMSFNTSSSELSWDYIRGAVEYDVEWVFIDVNDNFTYSSSVPDGPFLFKEPVRITTYKHHHNLDLIYPVGTVYFRVRPKGYFSKTTSSREIYYSAPWSYAKKIGTGTMNTVITADFESEKNWQYTVAYAENGLSKSSITYMDGTFRARQQLSKMKSSGQVVAASTVYDEEGRQTVQIIPTPIVSGSLNYFNLLHQDQTGGVFDKSDFDYGVSNPLGTSSGAGQYYSANNGFLSDPYRERIPNAEGYAYTQTDFLNDNTGRPRSASGVGATHKMGGGHETQYFYENPTERDLRELFGSNVGEPKFYQKQTVVDANGQASVTYTDPQGRVIATALAASAPANLEALDNNPLGTVRTVTTDLIGSGTESEDDQSNQMIVTEFNHMNIGSNPVTLDYNLVKGAVNNDPPFGTATCASCFYKLEISVFDPTGAAVNLAYDSQTDGLSTIYPYIIEKYAGSQIDCNSPYYTPSLQAISKTVTFSLTGTYKIYKVLSVDQDAVNNYLATTALTLPGAPNLATYISTQQSTIVTTGCGGFDCASFYEQECRIENNLSPSGALLPADQTIVNTCIATKCGTIANDALNDQALGEDADYCANILEMLKNDVSPGGWVFEEENKFRTVNTNLIWDKDLTKSDGVTIFNPSSLQDLEDNWDVAFAAQIVNSTYPDGSYAHPEYCHYTKCQALANLKVYNQTLTGVTSWNNAVSGGYINGTTGDFITSTSNPTSPDPIYSSSIYTSTITNLVTAINNYQGTANQSIYDFVINYTPTLIKDQNGNAISNTNQPAYNNRVWELMRQFYLGEREMFMETYYTPTCAYYDNVNANFIDPTAIDNATPPLAFSNDDMNGSCPEICNANVMQWLSAITNACPTISQQNLDIISNNLQNYCLANCNSINNAVGAILLTDITTNNSNLVAVQNILNNQPCAYSLTNLSTNNGCNRGITYTVQVWQLSTVTSKNVAMLSNLAVDDYELFINSPAIQGNTSYFTPAYWASADMKVSFYNSNNGTPLLATKTISDIADISIQQHQFDVNHNLQVKIRVEFQDESVANYWITSFQIHNTTSSTLTFNVNSMTLNTVSYVDCTDKDQVDPFVISIPLQDYTDDCIDDIMEEATIMATQAYKDALEVFLSGLQGSFSTNCFNEGLDENFTLTYPKKEYDYTLYYYDQAGNLVQTVPPQGVHVVPSTAFTDGVWNGTTEPAHTMKTIYTYNSLQQITKSNTPDGGVSQMWYNAAQQVRFSQNAQQAVLSGGKYEYSYTKYDALGRPVEVGIANIASIATAVANVNVSNYPVATVSEPNREVVITHYEMQDLQIEPALGWNPKNLNTRIAAVAYYDSYTGADPLNYSNALFYNYDIHGNVVNMLTDSRTFDQVTINNSNIRYKTIDYKFDVYSGKVNEVIYQKEKRDQFIHRYEYDDDNRITGVYTSIDGIQWENDAKYYYYLHGPLARVELGEDKVQGIDYAYTVHGWLKGVNSNTALASNDLGKDGTIINETSMIPIQKQQRKRNRWMARDVYGFSLTYFNQGSEKDYSAIDSYVNPWLASNESAFLPASNANLYNGNIRTMVTALQKRSGDNNISVGTVARVYKYDQLQRIKEAQTYTAATLESTNSWSSAAATQTHYSSYQYDLNGNIMHLTRNGSGIGSDGNPTAYSMDDLSYTYYNADGVTGLPSAKNQLANVSDAGTGLYDGDLDSQSPNNYVYDAAGRLITDNAEQIQTIRWTATNKVAYIQRTATSMKDDIGFKYNPMGIRIAKIVYPKSAPGVIDNDAITITFYALDAQGNTMATYTQTTLTATSAVLEAFEIYGSARLGNKAVGTTLSTSTNFNYISADNRASAIITISSSTFNVGQDIRIKESPTAAISTPFIWTSNLETNAKGLVAAINEMTVTSDVSASIWYANNLTGTINIQLRYGQSGNGNGKTLYVYADNVSQIPLIKRQFGQGLAKGQYVAGTKRYELSNHLGNVLEVISDRKWGIDDGVYDPITGVKTSSTLNGTVDYYIADIVSYSDYDPFGTMQDGRKGESLQASKYNAGFQGQRTDDEIKGDGNSVDYKYRMYDPRIGRFFAIDPLAPKYAQWSPYVFSGNQVTATCELEGLEPSEDLNTADPSKIYQGKDRGGNGTSNIIYNWKVHVSSYTDKNGVTLESRQWLMTGTEYTGPTKEENAEMANHVYSSEHASVSPGDYATNTDYKLMKEYGGDGFAAALYGREIQGRYFYVLAFAGTDDVIDCFDDLAQGSATLCDQVNSAIMLAIRVDDWVLSFNSDNQLSFTGHSLGGGLASIASFSTNRKAVTFNAMGITWTNENAYPFGYVQNQWKNIDAYIIKGELLDTYQPSKADGSHHMVTPKESGHGSGYLHSIDRFLELYRK